MSDDIKIHKGLIVLAFGLLIALAAAAYVALPSAGSGASEAQSAAQIQNPGTQQPAPDSTAPAPSAQASAPILSGGCGCGGGGVNAAPDPSKAVIVNASANSSGANAQDVYIRALSDGKYDNGEIDVRKGSLVRLHFSADPNAGCGRQMVIYGLNIRAASQNGEEDVVEFIPQQEGTYEISCGMRMWGPGKLVVTS